MQTEGLEIYKKYLEKINNSLNNPVDLTNPLVAANQISAYGYIDEMYQEMGTEGIFYKDRCFERKSFGIAPIRHTHAVQTARKTSKGSLTTENQNALQGISEGVERVCTYGMSLGRTVEERVSKTEIKVKGIPNVEFPYGEPEKIEIISDNSSEFDNMSVEEDDFEEDDFDNSDEDLEEFEEDDFDNSEEFEEDDFDNSDEDLEEFEEDDFDNSEEFEEDDFDEDDSDEDLEEFEEDDFDEDDSDEDLEEFEEDDFDNSDEEFEEDDFDNSDEGFEEFEEDDFDEDDEFSDDEEDDFEEVDEFSDDDEEDDFDPFDSEAVNNRMGANNLYNSGTDIWGTSQTSNNSTPSYPNTDCILNGVYGNNTAFGTPAKDDKDILAENIVKLSDTLTSGMFKGTKTIFNGIKSVVSTATVSGEEPEDDS